MGHVLPVLGLYLKAERVLSLGVGQGVNIYTPILIVMCLKPQASSASTQIQWFVKSVTIAAECSYAVLLNYDLSPGGGTFITVLIIIPVPPLHNPNKSVSGKYVTRVIFDPELIF